MLSGSKFKIPLLIFLKTNKHFKCLYILAEIIKLLIISTKIKYKLLWMLLITFNLEVFKKYCNPNFFNTNF